MPSKVPAVVHVGSHLVRADRLLRPAPSSVICHMLVDTVQSRSSATNGEHEDRY